MKTAKPMTSSSLSNKYCIIGAGFCGLGIAKAFQDYGISFDCFEKNTEVGGNWLNGVYDSTHIISSKKGTQFSDFPMPRDYPDFPSRLQMLNYLQAYAHYFRLKEQIHFQTEVAEISPVDPNGMSGWNVRLSTGVVHQYKGVIIANGHHWDKRFPQYAGSFSGKILHSKDYKKPSDFEGNRVLVVGAGNSGCDIAVEAALQGHKSWISMRRGYYFLPKTYFGIPTDQLDRPWFPVFAQKIFLKSLLKLTNGSNEKYGLQKPDHDLYDHHPIINSQLLYFIRHGRVQPKRDISEFEGKTVHFVDGTQQEIDTLVYATGFHATFPFLDSKYFEWENGYPKRVASMMPKNIAGLYIFGLAQPRGGAGPLITKGSQFLAEVILAQEQLDHPISNDFAKVKSADSRVLIGVSQAFREIAMGRFFLQRIILRNKNPIPCPQPIPRIRNFKFPFDSSIPKNWLASCPLQSHVANSLNLIFPDGERYFIRSTRAYSTQLKDPRLKARIPTSLQAHLQKRVDAFFAQEVQHGREHENYFDILKAQGFQLEKFLYWYKRISYDWVERILPKNVRLAETAALEHYTAAFADYVLSDGFLKRDGHPLMADLFHWHAAEEIEHKAVAYDVMVAARISYPIRIAGLWVATAAFFTAWLSGLAVLLKQDQEVTWTSYFRMLFNSRARLRKLVKYLTRAFFQYCKPGFHPSQIDNLGLAHSTLFDLETRW